MRQSLLYIVVWVLLCSGCGRSYPDEIVLAERIIKEKPDSALSFLKSIKHEVNKKPIDIQMYYNLLLVKASDKSYELHTSDSLIKQVVLYYKEKKDYEKLTTAYYYLGRVYMDMCETPRALDAFQKAVEISSDEQNSDIQGLIFIPIIHGRFPVRRIWMCIYKKRYKLLRGKRLLKGNCIMLF